MGNLVWNLALDLAALIVLLGIVPERAFYLLRVYVLRGGTRESRRATFVKETRGFIIGLVFAAAVFMVFKASTEELMVESARSLVDSAKRGMGVDYSSVCVDRVIANQNFTCEAFANEAAEFGSEMLSIGTFSERQEILAYGNTSILFGVQKDSCEILQHSVEKYCARINPRQR